MKSLEQKIINFIDEHSLIKEGDKIIIALSGGPDSVFALYFFHKYKKKFKIEIFAAHLNHSLRAKESDKDEDFCKELCGCYDIKFFSERAKVQKHKSEFKLSLEEAARELRYAFLEDIAREIKADKIITAHNINDNTETVLLNLFKGTGAKGLSGIPIIRDKIIRPFLSASKTEIINYLEKKKIAYRLDETNLSNKFERNLLRNKIIPQIREQVNPALDEAILRSSVNLRNTVNIVNDEISRILDNEVHFKNTVMDIPLSIVNRYNEGFVKEIIIASLKRTFHLEFNYTNVKNVFSLFTKQTGKKVKLKNDIFAFREREFISVKKRDNERQYFQQLSIGETAGISNKKLSITEINVSEVKEAKSRNVEFIDGDNIEKIFTLRNWKRGDKFIPLGMKNFKKISDFLTEQKVKTSQRQNQLVLTNRNQIVWVVGLRIDERFKLKNKTKKVLQLCLN